MLAASVGLKRWIGIVLRAVQDAEQGDARAREWLGAYLLGKPTGDGLLKLAASARAGIDPIEATAHGIAYEAMISQLFTAELAELEETEPPEPKRIALHDPIVTVGGNGPD